MNEPTNAQTPYRQIRAKYDQDTITVYQAYQTTIAEAAVKHQKLNASPDFKPGRMTWIKPSWSWMMYRAGYSYKDARQARILALRMKHKDFIAILERAHLSTHKPGIKSNEPLDAKVQCRVQWDPERTPKLEILPYRSIQIGISGALSANWAQDMIVSIEDVTDKARELKKAIEDVPDITAHELVKRGLVPVERPFLVPEHIMDILEMHASRP